MRDDESRQQGKYKIKVSIRKCDQAYFSQLVTEFLKAINPDGGALIFEISAEATGECQALITNVPLPDDLIVVDDEKKQTVGEFIVSKFTKTRTGSEIQISYTVTRQRDDAVGRSV